MNKEELEKYKIRDYYMIPVEVVDNVFYLFEQQCKKQKEVIDKAVLELVNIDGNLSNSQLSDRICNLIDILKEEVNENGIMD